jgi:hypothetical protein
MMFVELDLGAILRKETGLSFGCTFSHTGVKQRTQV